MISFTLSINIQSYMQSFFLTTPTIHPQKRKEFVALLFIRRANKIHAVSSAGEGWIVILSTVRVLSTQSHSSVLSPLIIKLLTSDARIDSSVQCGPLNTTFGSQSPFEQMEGCVPSKMSTWYS